MSTPDKVLDIYSKEIDQTVDDLLEGNPETLKKYEHDSRINTMLKDHQRDVVDRYDDEEEDHLDVDSPIHDQKFVVISFAEKPLDRLAEIECFDFVHFMMNQTPDDLLKLLGRDPVSGRNVELNSSAEQTTDARNADEDYKKIWGNELNKIDRKSWEPVEPEKNESWNALYDRISKAYATFKRNNSVYLGNRYEAHFGNKRVDRMVKVRGSYKNITKCKNRIKQLKTDDPYHLLNVFEVGTWNPVNPDPWMAEEYETSDKKMNEMIRENKKEKDKARNAFNLRKELLLRQARRNNDELKAKNQLLAEEEEQQNDSDKLDERVKKIPENKKLIKTITEEEYQEMMKDPNVKDFGLAVGSSTMDHGMSWADGAMPNL